MSGAVALPAGSRLLSLEELRSCELWLIYADL